MSGLPQNSASSTTQHRATASHHAILLQHRKDLEAQILNATEKLLELPASDADPSRPSHEDADFVLTLLRPFQPSDLDALVEERNINRKCGYVLCPYRNRKQQTQANYRIVCGKGKGADALKIVEKEKLERWCSDDCERRTLYIIVQLSDEPAWTRSNFDMWQVTSILRDAKNEIKNIRIEPPSKGDRTSNHSSNDGEGATANLRTLAIERGTQIPPGKASIAEIKEILPMETHNQRELLQCSYSYDSVEGYSPRSKVHDFRANDVEDRERDIIDTI